VFESFMRDLDPTQYGEADRRQVDPAIEVQVAKWSTGGTLDWWVKERPRVARAGARAGRSSEMGQAR
jgi:hypothetical protein